MTSTDRSTQGAVLSRRSQNAPRRTNRSRAQYSIAEKIKRSEHTLSPHIPRTLNTAHDGFSLLELVVAVSIMLILGVVGFVSYQNYTDNARQAALDTSANQVLTAVIAEDNNPNGDDPAQVVADFNGQSDDIIVDIAAANANQLTVEAMRCDGGISRATVQGDHDHIETTAFRDVQYSWTGTPDRSPSTKTVCGEVVGTNLTPYGRYKEHAGGQWGTNNSLHIHYKQVEIHDHPQGLQFARESNFRSAALPTTRIDYYSDHTVAGLSRGDFDYFGVWVWSSVPAEVELDTRTYKRVNKVDLPANTWKFVVSKKGAAPGVHVYLRESDRHDPAMREQAVARVTGVIATNDAPPTEFFDGDSR